MEAKINIVEILKDKPQGIRLYSPIFGKCCLNTIKKKCKFPIKIEVGTARVIYSFTSDGKYSVSCKDGEMLLFPSKEMQDWSKFQWKKGDVLVSNDGSTEVIFDKWYDDTYTNFYCKHYLNSEDENNIKYNEAFLCTTERYSLEDKNSVQTYINTIEEKLGGQLNFEALEIEKAQSKVELKSLDMVLVKDYKDSEWYLDAFESMVPNCIYPYKCMMNLWKYCIPYRGNEHLLGTTKDVEG